MAIPQISLFAISISKCYNLSIMRKRLYGGYKSQEKQREAHRKWKRSNPDKVRQHNRKYYEKHKEKLQRIEGIRTYNRLAERRKRMKELRLRVITHYGNGECVCVQCGFSDIRALSIDHVNNDGAEKRKIIKDNIYTWLERNNYPEGYQTLCMNCQWIKKREYEESHRRKQSKYLIPPNPVGSADL